MDIDTRYPSSIGSLEDIADKNGVEIKGWGSDIERLIFIVAQLIELSDVEKATIELKKQIAELKDKLANREEKIKALQRVIRNKENPEIELKEQLNRAARLLIESAKPYDEAAAIINRAIGD